MRLSQKELRGPCVYIVNKGNPAYIGLGINGMGRIFDSEKSLRTEAIENSEYIEILFCDTPDAARKLEAELIHKHHPDANRFCPHCSYYRQKYPACLRAKGQLFGKARHEILALLLTNPERGYSSREVARKLNMSPGAVHRGLGKLVQVGIISRRLHASHVFYQAEECHPVFQELSSLISKGV